MFKLPSLLQPIMSNHTLLQRLRDYVSWVIKPEIDRVFTSQIIYIIFSHSSEISHCSPNQVLAFPQNFSKGKYLQLFQGAKSIHTAYVKPSIHNWTTVLSVPLLHCSNHSQAQALDLFQPCDCRCSSHPVHTLTYNHFLLSFQPSVSSDCSASLVYLHRDSLLPITAGA